MWYRSRPFSRPFVSPMRPHLKRAKDIDTYQMMIRSPFTSYITYTYTPIVQSILVCKHHQLTHHHVASLAIHYSSSSSSSSITTVSSLCPLPKNVLAYFTRTRLGQVANNLDLLWHHKATDLLIRLGPRQDFLAAHTLPLFDRCKHLRSLSPFLVLYRHHCCLEYVGMCEDRGFQRKRRDVLPSFVSSQQRWSSYSLLTSIHTADDDVLASVNYLNCTIRMPDCQIARM